MGREGLQGSEYNRGKPSGEIHEISGGGIKNFKLTSQTALSMS